MRTWLFAYLGLLVIGAAWGISSPSIKIATQAGHHPAAIILIQASLNVVLLGFGLMLTGQLRNLPLDRAHLRLYLVVGLAGVALSNLAIFIATTHLPAGVISIIISLVPLFALPLALALKTERFEARRMAGVILGAIAIGFLIGPEASLPGADDWIWVLIAALAPLLYAIEGAYVAGTSATRANPVQILWASYFVVLATMPFVVWGLGVPLWNADGFGLPEAAFITTGILGNVAYVGYLMLLRFAGQVFGALVAYTVTGMGILWSMTLLGERYSAWVWGALALLFLALFLVTPRARQVKEA